jgi:hypothetical protein
MSQQDEQTFSTQQQRLHHRRLVTSGLIVIQMSYKHGQDLLGHLLLLLHRKDLADQPVPLVLQARQVHQDHVATLGQQAQELTSRDDMLRMARLSPHNLLVLLVTRI